MDTNRLKKFAAEARRTLLQGVAQRLTALGFREDGSTAEKPELMGGGAVFMGNVYSEDFYHKWMSLANRLQHHSWREVVEEAAYTWFNRLVAIRIMAKNELVPPVLEYESDEVRIPIIVTEARQGRLPDMTEENRKKLEGLLQNDALTDEQFALLIVAYCHSNPVIHKCFGSIADYTELLLPSNILKADGFVDALNDDDYLTDDDYHSPELIGWLYQFYISERKDEVFAKKGKFEADEIPAATQIFTPNWIVKYMVQNTVGRIYLDNNPYSDDIKESLEYLVEPAEPTLDDAIFHFDDIHDLTCADLGCGSGHILNECFDLLYQLYIEEGYNRRRAVEDIFRYNLTGVDIDTRARQLATFALLMKACSKDKSFADAHCMPRVLDMPEPYAHKHDLQDVLPHFLLGSNAEMVKEIIEAITLMDNAHTLGSIMKFNLSEHTRNAIAVRMEEYRAEEHLPEPIRKLMPYMEVILALTEKYAALVMNPPYMGGGNMNKVLGDYVKKNYPDGKTDLFSVFMEVATGRLSIYGKYGMINQDSWMFKSGFERLRRKIINTIKIDSLLHLGARTFDEISGEVVQNASFVFSKANPDEKTSGIYFRLLTGGDCGKKEQLFLESTNKNFNKYRYNKVLQKSFENIPGLKMGYWLSKEAVQCFQQKRLGSVLLTREGMAPADEKRFWRLWYEISTCRLSIYNQDSDKWYPYVKGGSFRKWYGNLEYIVDWANNGYDIRNNKDPLTGRIRSHNYNGEYAFKECLSWTVMYFGRISIRYTPKGCLWDSAGASGFSEKKLIQSIALLNSNVTKRFISVLSDAKKMNVGEVAQIPFIDTNQHYIEEVSLKNISISKQDWDAHETSWDFQENELLALAKGHGSENNSSDSKNSAHGQKIADLLNKYHEKWEGLFIQLHANEEELNRRFIDIYGLQDELSPEVPLSEVTILQQDEITINEANQIVWHDDVVIKQLISYAVGCMMGRYSIDRKELILANQGNGIEQYKQLVPNSRFEIDDDGIIPLMSINPELADNAAQRFKNWLSTAFGEETLIENLNCVEAALGKRIENYFAKDFWKDHKKMYQNRPIYWLFSSKRGAFQCLVYMHRMNAYTAECVRTAYLLPHIEWLTARQQEMQANAANLSARERREMDNIGKQIAECREYHDRLHEVADQQIAFDLDDGVIVNYAKFGDVLAKLK